MKTSIYYEIILLIILIVNSICLLPKLNNQKEQKKSININRSENEYKSKVYFTRNLTSESILQMYKKLNITMKLNMGIKIHTGEDKSPYFITPTLLHKLYNINTHTVYLESNTNIPGRRNETFSHVELMEEHGWTLLDRRYDIMDAMETKELPIPNGLQIKKNYAGAGLNDVKSCVVISHLTGNKVVGYSGALRQLSLGFAARKGKNYILSGGRTTEETFPFNATLEEVTNSMADAASSIIDYFDSKEGKVIYINVLKDISEDCDCTSMPKVPRINDIGILGSIDPIAIDKASIELIKNSTDEGVQDWVKQLEEKKGENVLDAGEILQLGTKNFEIIDLDSEKHSYSYYLKNHLVIIYLLLVLLL